MEGNVLPGTMQRWPLVVPSILQYAARWHPEQQVVCKTVEGPVVVSTYADLSRRAQLCALALKSLGVRQGSVIATLAWNTTRHLEAWYGIMGIGAVCHTLNPRLSDKDLIYIANHARDQVLLADTTFLPILRRILPHCPAIKAVIMLTDSAHMPSDAAQLKLLCYDDLLESCTQQLPFHWPELDEELPCGLCYTSGTTGNPKGVQYTHRSNFLHAMMVTAVDAGNLGSGSSVLMVVPMFHANSWGTAFSGPMVGHKLVLPGPHLDGKSLVSLGEEHRVTHCFGVPTVWLGLLNYLDEHKIKLQHMQYAIIGGAAPPRSMIERLEAYGVEVRHMWGMTELSPIGTVGTVKGTQQRANLSKDDIITIKTAQGRPHIMADTRIVDDMGRELPHDGVAMGHWQVRGPIVVGRYHNLPASVKPAAGEDNWFDTGDVCTIDKHGLIRITDRSKDVIKSGGEWISSIEVENAAMGHPGVEEAAVIGVANDKWGERPLLVMVPKGGVEKGNEQLRDSVLQWLQGKVAKYAVPDDVVFVKEIPHNATGKVYKLELRAMFKDYKPSRPGGNSRL